LQPEFRVVRTIRSPDHVIKDDLTGEWRLSSGAYSPANDKLVSVDLEQLLAEDELPPLAMYPALNRSVAAATHSISELRGSNLDVVHDPTNKNWYHGGISGITNKKMQRKLAESAGFLVPIDPTEAQKLKDVSDQQKTQKARGVG